MDMASLTMPGLDDYLAQWYPDVRWFATLAPSSGDENESSSQRMYQVRSWAVVSIA